MGCGPRGRVDQNGAGKGKPSLSRGVATAMTQCKWGWVAVALGLIAISTAAMPQVRGRLTALASLRPGLWEVREINNPRAAPASFCVTDPNILMQVQHRNEPCSRLVISNKARDATVHYTCPTGGFGRSSIRVESRELAVLETQGIAAGLPFEYRATARRKRACTPATSR